MVFAYFKMTISIYIRRLLGKNAAQAKESEQTIGQNLPSLRKIVTVEKWGLGFLIIDIRPDSLL